LLPPTLHVVLRACQGAPLRGEPRSAGRGRYRERGNPAGWWEGLVQHGGRELSYLNLLDAEAAWQLSYQLVGPDGLSFADGLAAAGDREAHEPVRGCRRRGPSPRLTDGPGGNPVSAFRRDRGPERPRRRGARGNRSSRVRSPTVLVAPRLTTPPSPASPPSERTCGRSQRLSRLAWSSAFARPTEVSCPGMRSLRISARDVASGDEPYRPTSSGAISSLPGGYCRSDFVQCDRLGSRWAGSRYRVRTARTAWTRPGSPVARLAVERKEEQEPVMHTFHSETGWTK